MPLPALTFELRQKIGGGAGISTRTSIPEGAGQYTETLTDNILPANDVDQQTGSSLCVLYVLDGKVTVAGDAGMAGSLATGNGAYWLPGANLSVTADPTGAHYLLFTLSPATS